MSVNIVKNAGKCGECRRNLGFFDFVRRNVFAKMVFCASLAAKAKTAAPKAHNAAICPAPKRKNSAKTAAEINPPPRKAHRQSAATKKKINSLRQIFVKKRASSAKWLAFSGKIAPKAKNSRRQDYCRNWQRAMRRSFCGEIASHTPKKPAQNWQETR